MEGLAAWAGGGHMDRIRRLLIFILAVLTNPIILLAG